MEKAAGQENPLGADCLLALELSMKFSRQEEDDENRHTLSKSILPDIQFYYY